MARLTGSHRLLAAASLLLAAGCVALPDTPETLYRPASDPESQGYGYTDHRNADGSWTIQVRMPPYTGDAINVASAVWRRRAEALCGRTGFRQIIFRAERLTAYDSYNNVRVPGDFLYAGYAECTGETPARGPGAVPGTAEPQR